MSSTPRSPALAVAVLFGLFALVMFMDPAHFSQDTQARTGPTVQARSVS